MASTLYVVATPIGNLEDITLRAIRTLKQVDLVAAEDTRHTLRLLRALEIQKPLLSLHEHNEQKRIEEISQRLKQGQDIALVSDAGTPCISDPGARLIQALAAQGAHICPIPGPSAAITALSATGLTQGGFIFFGFLPPKGKERRQKLEALCQRTCTAVLYESPHKLLKTLQDISIVCHDPQITIGRELTKVYEEFLTDNAETLIARYTEQPPKGEFVLMLPADPDQAGEIDLTQAQALMERCLSEGMGHKQAAELVAKQTGVPKKQAYQWGLQFFHK